MVAEKYQYPKLSSQIKNERMLDIIAGLFAGCVLGIIFSILIITIF